MNMIKTICFDLDGVYFLNGKSNFISALKEKGISEDEAKRVFLKSDEMNKQYKVGTMSDEEYWTWALKEWNLEMSVKEITDLLIAGYEVNQSAVDYVKKVRAAGYKTAVCTNNFPARINGLQKRFGFLDDFDVQVFSYQVGVVKPNKQIFEKLVELSSVQPDEIFYSDDDNNAVTAANEVGISTYFYENFDGFLSKLKNLGVTV